MNSPVTIYTILIAICMALTMTACEDRSAEKNISKETTTVNKGEQINRVSEKTKKKSSQNNENAEEEVKY
jgi:hypothetical protein